MKKIFIGLAICLSLCVDAHAKSRFFIEAPEYAGYATQSGTTNVHYLHDPLSRLILSFSLTDSVFIEAWVYDYDPVGNLLKKIHVSMLQDKDKKDRYNVQAFEYTTLVYDKANALVCTNQFPLNKKLLRETKKKISERLSQK